MVKKVFIGILLLAAVTATALLYFENNTEAPTIEKEKVKVKTTQAKPVKEVSPVNKTPVKVEPVIQNAHLYSGTDMSLLSVTEIAKMPQKMQDSVNKLFEESTGFYFVKYNKALKRAEILLKSPLQANSAYIRHNLQFAEIDKDGNITYRNAGYNGEDNEAATAIENSYSQNDEWEFETKSKLKRPIKHTAYDENGFIKFKEYWNYSPEEQISYKMIGGRGQIVSVIKNTSERETNYRVEHIFYNEDGNITMDISASYDSGNITRFTYYNASQKENSLSILNEYENGVKAQEQIYNSDYKLVNTIKSEENDGERTLIRIFDGLGNELKILQQN